MLNKPTVSRRRAHSGKALCYGLTLLCCFLVNTTAHAQYQKMVKSNSLFVAGAKSHIQATWGKQMTNRSSLTFGGLYFRDEEKVVSTDNFGANLGFNRWLVRVKDGYLSAGAGGFIMQTNAESVAANEADDTSFGIDFRTEVEYYLSWRFSVFGEAKQFFFFGSEFFDNQFLVSGGLRVVL